MYKGVSRVKNYSNFSAYIMYPKVGRVHLGYYKLPEHAAIAHDIAVNMVFKNNEYYKLNYTEGFWLTEDTFIRQKVKDKIDTFYLKQGIMRSN